ncbi:MAG: purine-binding chemotaxis protein CheW [Chromatiales bacterium]|nr:purine-binding chemotaxis protein CheW [Chromatiales bacterium]
MEHPVDLLSRLDARGRSAAAVLPERAKVKRQWVGVAFRVAGQHFVAPLAHVRETVNFPALTRVPATRDWFLGVTNLRGVLLPIVDLQIFAGGRPTVVGRRSHVLVIEHGGVHAGLLVVEVGGVRRFTEDQVVGAPTGSHRLDKFVLARVRDDEREWRVFSTQALAADGGFLRAAL